MISKNWKRVGGDLWLYKRGGLTFEVYIEATKTYVDQLRNYCQCSNDERWFGCRCQVYRASPDRAYCVETGARHKDRGCNTHGARKWMLEAFIAEECAKNPAPKTVRDVGWDDVVT